MNGLFKIAKDVQKFNQAVMHNLQIVYRKCFVTVKSDKCGFTYFALKFIACLRL